MSVLIRLDMYCLIIHINKLGASAQETKLITNKIK
jgi:hypothetical protein